MNEILVIRHGETDWNAQGRLQGTMDTPLNTQGIRQAEAAAQALKGQGIRLIYASPLIRARITAEIIGKALGVPIVYRDGLKEKDFGTMQGLTLEEIDARYGEQLWSERSVLDAALPGGESNRAVLSRLEPVIEEVKALQERVLVVTHGAVARLLYRLLTQPEEEAFHRFRLHNCEILAFRPLPVGSYFCETLKVDPIEAV